MSDFERYNFQSQDGERVTSLLGVMDKPALRYWYAKMTAADALPRLDKKAHQQLLDEATASHEATKTHQTRHQRVCDFVPDALKWLAGAPTRIRDTAGARGTAVHEAAEGDDDLGNAIHRSCPRRLPRESRCYRLATRCSPRWPATRCR